MAVVHQPDLPLERPSTDVASARSTETSAELLARGVCRALRGLGYRTLTEMKLASGRRVDVMGLDRRGRFAVVEIKTSLADLRADRKWSEYLPYCDSFFFGVPSSFPLMRLPIDSGLIVADRFGGEILRQGDTRPMTAATRQRQTLLFALKASGRLYRIHDPEV